MTIFRGRNAALRHTARGTVISARAHPQWRHPWSIRCRWELDPADAKGERRAWFGYVKAGFVNGRDVTIAAERDGQQLDVALTDEAPAGLALTWRNPLAPGAISATPDGELVAGPGEGYPPYFDELGVKRPATGGNALQAGTLDPASDDRRTREIRACDVVLIVPRLATAQEVTVMDPLTDAQTISIGTTFHQDYYNLHRAHPYRLRATAKWQPPRDPDPLERLMGAAAEPQSDELKIATVWMVSPPGRSEEDEPDQSWSAYPQHQVFWNLMHASRNQPPAGPSEAMQFSLPLAGGVAQPVVNAILSPVNDAYAQVMAYLGAADYQGLFWNT